MHVFLQCAMCLSSQIALRIYFVILRLLSGSVFLFLAVDAVLEGFVSVLGYGVQLGQDSRALGT